MTPAAVTPPLPECANGCPLTDPSGCAAGGCIRAARVPVYVTVADPEPRVLPPAPAYLGTPARTPADPRPPARPPAPVRNPDATGTVRVTPDIPFQWRPLAALAVVLTLAVLCALAGWTR